MSGYIHRFSRRQFLRAGVGALPAVLSPPLAAAVEVLVGKSALLGFAALAPSDADAVRVPPGYSATPLLRWGDPVGSSAGMPAFKPDASNSAAEQALQAGMHCDGMHFFPITGSRSDHGLLVLNHEYVDENLLHADGNGTWTAEKTAKSMHAVGVSVVEARLEGGQWRIVRPSKFARRIHLGSPMRVAGPAAGHALMRTAADPQGTVVQGTMMNCAQGRTPWGTYLTCEENWHAYFATRDAYVQTPLAARYGVAAGGYGLPHFMVEPRFDLGKSPNEPHRFGWVVEIDPFDAQSTPVKRTALGRMRHEAAGLAIGADRRLAWYLTDDAPFEYLYKFVASKPWNPANRAANRDLLDDGTLHVARFHQGGRGEWLPLTYGSGVLTAANGFADQGDVVIKARLAADAMGATKMDRTEGAAVHPLTREVFIACTNNAARGAPGREGPNPANPRSGNFFGHILRIREAGGNVAAKEFEFGFFALAGNPALADANLRGNVRGDAFGAPDNLFVDARGLLWIQTDYSPAASGPYAGLGNNQMLAGDPATGEVRRFLTAPRGAEVAGCVLTPDAKTLFVNIQHPGDGSTWPDGGRPRSATVVVRRDDGGIIGS